MSCVNNLHNIRKNGRFVKKKRLDREVKAATARSEKAAAKRQRLISDTLEVSDAAATAHDNAESGELDTFLQNVMEGRRIVDIKMLWSEMWCKPCKRGLSFRDIIKESVRGLAYVWRLRCPACLMVTEARSSNTYYSKETGRQRYVVNAKVMFGMTDIDMGPDLVNKVLSALNVPCLDAGMLSRAREDVGPAVIHVAKESCREALALEKQLTEKSPMSVPARNPPNTHPGGAP